MKIVKARSIVAAVLVLSVAAVAPAQPVKAKPVDKWVSAEGVAAGTDEKARDAAVAHALRKAVEQACGVFIKAQTKSQDYKAVYDKIFANTVGYVREHKVISVSTDDEKTTARIRARVSTKKFEKDWAAIAHTVDQENNPRVIIAIAEAVHQGTGGPTHTVKDSGAVQGKVEDFFLAKSLRLMDRQTSADVTKRDVLLAAIKNNDKEVAALGARFKADVVVTGRATAKYGKRINVGGQALYQYTGTLSIRVVRTDSAGLLVSKTFGPVTVNTLHRAGGDDKVLAKLGEEFAPKLLAAVVKAWRKQVHVRRNVQIIVTGMDYKAWKDFRDEVKKVRGVEALRLRDITESTATIDVEFQRKTTDLADILTELKKTQLEVTEITANRVKLKVVTKAEAETE